MDATVPSHRDLAFEDWCAQLRALSSSPAIVREAKATMEDARRMRHLQVACSPISVKAVEENISTIAAGCALFAEIDEIPVGFCLSHPSTEDSGPLYIQVVGVAIEAQRRGTGLALLSAAAQRDPKRDIVLATQDSNLAARAMNERFATSIGASVERVALGTFPDSDLGISRGLGYRSWIIRRPRPSCDR